MKKHSTMPAEFCTDFNPMHPALCSCAALIWKLKFWIFDFTFSPPFSLPCSTVPPPDFGACGRHEHEPFLFQGQRPHGRSLDHRYGFAQS